MYTVKQYTAQDYETWNSFVSASKNGTFLFHRDFMEYHADRFSDFSLIVFDGQKPVALLPANRVAHAVHSHQGLTYGSLVLGHKTYLTQVIAAMRALLEHLHLAGIEKLHIKQIPYMYHKVPAQETDYILFLCKGGLVRRDSLSVIENSSALNFIKSRKEAVKRGGKNNLCIAEDDDFDLFWERILIPNLKQRYNAAPVHTVEEIKLLRQRFPENIRHFN
ncbi:MAG: GNAT family N-acetyltransferase, partial [Sphingobacteriales bacterium]